MNTITIGQHEIPLEMPHPVVLYGLLEAYSEPVDQFALRMAFLGFALRGPHKAPQRYRAEPYAQYGQRVYDHLIGLGASHHGLVRDSDTAIADAFRTLPQAPTAQEVRALGEASGSPDCTTGSSSLTDGAETPSCG